MLDEQAAEKIGENEEKPENAGEIQPMQEAQAPAEPQTEAVLTGEQEKEAAVEETVKEEIKEPPASEPAIDEVVETEAEEAAPLPKEEAPATDADAIKAEEIKGEPKWYVIQTYSGQEDKVKLSIEKAVEKNNMQKKIIQVLVPTEETVEIRGSKRLDKVKKMFPGYVFVEMVLDDDSWYAIRQTPGVSRFIGSKTAPTPVLDREMQRVLKQLGVKQEKLEITFEVGEAVRVISGPFRGYTGSVNEINQDKGKLKVLINIFGRDTPVEVNFEHAEKVV